MATTLSASSLYLAHAGHSLSATPLIALVGAVLLGVVNALLLQRWLSQPERTDDDQ